MAFLHIGELLLNWLGPPLPPESTAPRRALSQLGGSSGTEPLVWWAAGSYEGTARHQLLRLRDQPRPQGLEPWLAALVPLLREHLGASGRGIVVPVPSWKRRANPLPALLATALSRQLGWTLRLELLRRSRPVLGQHHLGRELRLANQQGAFLALPASRHHRGPRPPVLLVDDILTTGATACAAAEALQQEGWRLEGLACLARTPARRSHLRSQRRRGCDLRSLSRQGDGPG
jgi:predicted amidophosphoribosyltransferase